MITGDEPSLPQPSDDNSPMISSIQTRVIADARGAYLAGNLKALIGCLDADQFQLFHRLLIEQGLTLSSVIDFTGSLAEVAGAIQTWIHIPSAANASAPLDILMENGLARMNPRSDSVPSVEYLDYSRPVRVAMYLTHAVLHPTTAVDYINMVVRARLFIDNERSHHQMLDLMTIVKQWQIEAAWTILQGKQPPPFEIPI